MTRFRTFTELQLDGDWVDITGDVYQRQDIEIARGRADESSRVDPAKCKLLLNNRSGKYSPRNPNSELFGKIGRNTPIRVGVGVPPAGAGTFVDTPASGETTDLSHDAPSVVARASGLLLCSWMTVRKGTYTVPASMTLDAETDSMFSTMATATEALASSGATGVRTATYTLDPDMVVFGHAHVSAALPGTPVVEESIADAARDADITVRTGDAQLGWWLVALQGWAVDDFDTMPFVPGGTEGQWRIIADSVIATDQGPHIRAWARPVTVAGVQEVFFATSDHLQEQHVRVWVVSGMDWSSIRFAGEVAAWPPRWELSAADVWVPVQAAGIKRRLGAGRKPLHSAIYRETLSPARRRPVAYWPAEDGEGSRFLASALDGGTPMRVIGVDSANLASYTGFTGSDSLPVVNDARFFGDVGAYVPGDETQAQWLMHVDDAGATDEQPIITLRTDTNLRWEVRYETGGALSVAVFGPNADGDVVLLQDSGAVNFNLDGLDVRAALEIFQEGADIRYSVGLVEPGATSGSRMTDQTVTGQTMGSVLRVSVGEGKNLGNVVVGHLAVYSIVSSIFDLGEALTGWSGELAGQRFLRLCREEGVPAVMIGDPDATKAMGPQTSDTLLNLLGEVADADGGIFHETRDDIGLTYRTRMTLYNQGQT